MEKKKLSEFLKDNGVYESFIENCLNDKGTVDNIKSNELKGVGIPNGFTWSETSQGLEYWQKLYFKLRNGIIHDMDEILYKEYERRNMKESSEQNPITKDIVENNEVENTKQEFQTITLNGVDYYLVPKKESPLLTLNDLRDIGLSDEDLIANGYSEEDLRKEPREKHLKRKFEEGNGQYEVLFKEKKSKDWSFCYRPCDLSWRKDWYYKLIKKEHKEIFKTYLKDNTLKIQYRWHDEDWMLLDDFIENYDEDMQLRLAKKEFEPFTLNIEINTIDEAKSLWNRFYIGNYAIASSIDISFKIDRVKHWEEYSTWDYLDDLLQDLGEEPDVTR